MKRLIVLGVVLSVVLAGCSVRPGDKVAVTVQEYSISLDPASATAGRVRLLIDSIGNEVHDLRLMPGKTLEELPRTPEGKLDLVANRPMDEIEEFEPGHYIATSPNLPAGQYVVVCTIHVDQGMVANFKVNPRKKKAA